MINNNTIKICYKKNKYVNIKCFPRLYCLFKFRVDSLACSYSKPRYLICMKDNLL